MLHQKNEQMHFHYLVEYQVNRHPWPEVAAKFGFATDQKTVEAGARSAAKIIGLKLRQEPRGRKPRQAPIPQGTNGRIS